MNKRLKKKILMIIVQINILCSLLSCKKQNIYYEEKESSVIYMLENMNIEIIQNYYSSNGDIVIYDYRNDENPGIKIYDSYKIKKIKDMKQIIDVIYHYNNNFVFTSKLKRTELSMLLEWIIHNICYDLNINTDKTKDIDFNNNELKYFLK